VNITTKKEIKTPYKAQAKAMEYGCGLIFHDKQNITIVGKNENYKKIVKKILEGK
jgi:hypothetical protein